jgi:hypothetical protein
MRPRALWIIGSAVAVLGLSLSLILLLPRNEAEFDFLQGKTPLRMNPSQAKKLRRTHQRIDHYTFKGDYQALQRNAVRELRLKGLTESTPLKHTPPLTISLSGPDEGPYSTTFVNIIGSARATLDVQGYASGDYVYSPGWVWVIVISNDQPTLFDNVRSWFGL